VRAKIKPLHQMTQQRWRNKTAIPRLLAPWILGHAEHSSSTKSPRNRVDISSKELARYWCKRLKKSKAEIEAAIAKVGDNAETVMKELGAKRT
jgi:hypothetical protein